VPFQFSEKCSAVFTKSKEALTIIPILDPPNQGEPFKLMCDTSNYAVDILG